MSPSFNEDLPDLVSPCLTVADLIFNVLEFQVFFDAGCRMSYNPRQKKLEKFSKGHCIPL